MQNREDAATQSSENSGRRTVSRRSALGTLAVGTGAILAAGSLPVAQASNLAAPTQQPTSTSPLGRIGLNLAHEEYPAPQLVQFGTQGEAAGFDNLWTSDHFQPWQDNEGHAGYARVTQAILGQVTKRVGIGTYVTCPTIRYRPAEIAQAFATLSLFTPNRVILAVGSGEALNEAASTGMWGNYAERAARLIEAITIIRQMWTGQTVTFTGKYYQVKQARLYDPPPQTIPIYVAATGPKSMRLAGQYGDGLVTDVPDYYIKNKSYFEDGARAAGKDPATLPVITSMVSVAGTVSDALPEAEKWRFSPQSWTAFVNNYNPVWIHQQADQQIPIQDVYKNWVISENPQDHAKMIKNLWSKGFTHINVNIRQTDQQAGIDFYAKQVLPLLK